MTSITSVVLLPKLMSQGIWQWLRRITCLMVTALQLFAF